MVRYRVEDNHDIKLVILRSSIENSNVQFWTVTIELRKLNLEVLQVYDVATNKFVRVTELL